MNPKHLLIICGPTAVGKTALSVTLAKHFGTEIISADSRQLYKEMSIGTAKPTVQEMQGVPHHFIDCISIQQNYTAGDYEKEVIQKLDELSLDLNFDLSVLNSAIKNFDNELEICHLVNIIEGIYELSKEIRNIFYNSIY